MKELTLDEWIAQNYPNFENPDELEFDDTVVECDECNGEGYIECDLHYDHDCHFCDGDGVVNKQWDQLSNAKQREVYKERYDWWKKYTTERLKNYASHEFLSKHNLV